MRSDTCENNRLKRIFRFITQWEGPGRSEVSMADIQAGGCLCQAVRYYVSGYVGTAIQCYCRDCQHVSGAGHLPQSLVDERAFAFSGSLKVHRRLSESGNDLKIAFCGECGSPIYKATSLLPGKLFIAAGSLDDPSAIAIENKVYVDRKQPWDAS